MSELTREETEMLRAIASRHARDAVAPLGSGLHPGDRVVIQEKLRAEEIIFYALKEAALTARSEGFREGVEAAAKVCYPIIRREQGWEEDNHVALLVEIQNTIRALSPRETDADAQAVLTGSEATQVASSHRPTAEPAASAPFAKMAERLRIPESIRKEIERECYEAEHPKGMSIHDGRTRIKSDRVRMLLARVDHAAALLSKVGQTQPDENPPPPERP